MIYIIIIIPLPYLNRALKAPTTHCNILAIHLEWAYACDNFIQTTYQIHPCPLKTLLSTRL